MSLVPENIDQEEVMTRRENYDDPHHIILTEDHCSLFLRSWPAESETAILILHGITAHSQPYEVMAKPISESGFQVFGLDLRGHGLSSGNRGDYKSHQLLLDDLTATITYIRKTLGYSSIVLLGHSLGVYTTLNVIYYNLADINGVALFSAALKTKEGVRAEMGIWEKIKIAVSSFLLPSKPVITYFREGMKGLEDPLFNFKYTLRFFKVFDTDNIELPIDLEVPLYMAIGDEDELFAVDAAKDLFDDVDSPDKTFQVMAKSKHAEFEPGAFGNFIEWLKERYS